MTTPPSVVVLVNSAAERVNIVLLTLHVQNKFRMLTALLQVTKHMVIVFFQIRRVNPVLATHFVQGMEIKIFATIIHSDKMAPALRAS